MKREPERLKSKILDDYYSTEDIARALLALTETEDDNGEIYKELEKALYDYIAVPAQNEHERDCFRVLYNILLLLPEKAYRIEFINKFLKN